MYKFSIEIHISIFHKPPSCRIIENIEFLFFVIKDKKNVNKIWQRLLPQYSDDFHFYFKLPFLLGIGSLKSIKNVCYLNAASKINYLKKQIVII